MKRNQFIIVKYKSLSASSTIKSFNKKIRSCSYLMRFWPRKVPRTFAAFLLHLVARRQYTSNHRVYEEITSISRRSHFLKSQLSCPRNYSVAQFWKYISETASYRLAMSFGQEYRSDLKSYLTDRQFSYHHHHRVI